MFKKAQTEIGPTLVWIFVLLGLLGTGLIFVLFNQVMTEYLVPAFGSVAISNLNATQNTTFTTQINYMLDFWAAIPYIMFVLILAFGITQYYRSRGNEI